jgi:acetylornithine aminotransferase
MLGTTFGGNPLACAAALAVAETIENERLLENATIQGNYLIDELSKLSAVTEIRGRGLMIGIDLPQERADVRQRLLYEKGVFTGEAKPNIIRLLPSLALKRAEADHFLEAFRSLI